MTVRIRVMTGWARVLINAVAVAGAASLAIAALAASAQAGSILAYAWRQFPTYVDWKWAGIDVVLLTGVALALWLVMHLQRHRLLVILALAAILRLAAVAVVTTPIMALYRAQSPVLRSALRTAEAPSR